MSRLKPGILNDLLAQIPGQAPGIEEPPPLQPTEILPATFNASSEPEPNVLLEHLAALWRHKFLIAGLCILGSIIGYVYYLLSPPLYAAQTTFELQGINEAFMNMIQLDPRAGTGTNTAGGINMMTQVRIIDSPSVRNPVIERLQREMTPTPPDQSGLGARARNMLRIGPQDPLENLRRALERAIGTVNVRPIAGTRLVAISCESTIPDAAANVVNGLVSEYAAQNMQFRSTSAQGTTQWMEGQLEDTKNKLAQSEKKLKEFQQNSGGVFVSEQEPLANSRLRQLQSELSSIQGDRISKQAKYDMAKTSPPDALPDVVDDANLREYLRKIATLRGKKAELLQTLTEEHYKVKEVTAQIEDMEKVRERERESLMRRIYNDYEAALNKEKLLAAEYNRQSGTILSQSDKAGEYGALKREVDTLKMYMNNLLQQTNQSVVVSVAPTNTVRVIDAARPASEPYKPTPYQSTLYGFCGGIALGAGIALGRMKLQHMRMSKKFSSPGHTSSLLAVPELGVIPSVGGEKAMSRWRRKPIEALGQNGERSNGWTGLVTAQKSSLLADSFRLVLTSLRLMERNGHPWKVIAVTSPSPGEGKTTVLSHLAYTMAESQRHVLVIDGDLRKPRLHKSFGVENGRGLSDLILGPESADVNWRDVVVPSGVPGVSIMTAGTIDGSGGGLGKLINSPQALKLLMALRNEFDSVLIDTPPMLLFPEARNLSRLADGVILVLRAAATDRESALDCRRRLQEDGTRLLGTILNDWYPQDSKERLYQRYYQYYLRPDGK